MAYTVFIPVVSLVMQKIQAQNILPIMHSFAPGDAISRQFIHLCRWNMAGALAQLFASAIAVNIFAMPAFAILSCIAGYQVIETSLNCFQQVAIVSPNGLVTRFASAWGYLLDFTV